LSVRDFYGIYHLIDEAKSLSTRDYQTIISAFVDILSTVTTVLTISLKELDSTLCRGESFVELIGRFEIVRMHIMPDLLYCLNR